MAGVQREREKERERRRKIEVILQWAHSVFGGVHSVLGVFISGLIMTEASKREAGQVGEVCQALSVPTSLLPSISSLSSQLFPSDLIEPVFERERMGQRIVQNNNNSQLVNGRVALALLGLSKRASEIREATVWAAGHNWS